MKEPKDLLGYCGFYCGDCLGYSGVIADAAKSLIDVLEKYDFRRTATSLFPEDLEAFDSLCEMLRFMAGLRCAGICRMPSRDLPRSSCEVRDCCQRKEYYSCHECDDFERCSKLASLHRGLHTDSCLKNLKAMREIGLDAWLSGGKRHHYWDKEDQ